MYLTKKKKEYIDFDFYKMFGEDDAKRLKDALNSDKYDKNDPLLKYIPDIKAGKIIFNEGSYISSLSDEKEIGYWRKANQIHNWFVENVQDGIDRCLKYEVSKEKIEELLEICMKILESATLIDSGQTYKLGHIEEGKFYETDEPLMILDDKTRSLAKTLLPSREGFFFGSTEYDSYYLDDIKYTAEILEKVLNETDFEQEAVFYCSSW